MPIYEYRCASCGFEKEYLQKVSDPLLTDCPECGKSTFEKQVSAAGFQLKGSGWYVTDYARKGNGGGKKDDAGSGASESKADSGKGEGTKSESSKADTKAESKPSTGSSAKSTT